MNGNGAGAIGERLLNERRYILPHQKPEKRRAILWSASTPRPVPVVFSVKGDLCQSYPDGTIKAWYDAHELARACQIWAEAGVRCNAESIIREVFG